MDSAGPKKDEGKAKAGKGKSRTPAKIIAEQPTEAADNKGFVLKLVGDSIKVWFGDSWQKCNALVNRTIPDLFTSNDIHPFLPLAIEKDVIDRETEIKQAFTDILAFSFMTEIRENIPTLRGCSTKLGTLQIQKMSPLQKKAFETIVHGMLTFMAVSSFISSAFKGLDTDKRNAVIAMFILPRLDDLIVKQAQDIPKEVRSAILKEIYMSIKFAKSEEKT